MKHSKTITPTVLAWMFPILLIIPNIALAITEYVSPLVKMTDIILPLGVYMFIVSLSSKLGRTVLLFLPIIILAAFQVVLLYLYGESIIAIDMFLNVATTNVSEVTELLSNLGIAIATVLIFYLPPLIWSVILVRKHYRCPEPVLKNIRRAGMVLVIAGLVLLSSCYLSGHRFAMRRDIFPVNVIANLIEAGVRTTRTQNYHATSAEYTFSAKQTHGGNAKEVYVFVIGETSRADNWQLFGYDRETTPQLSKRSDIVSFPYTLSESNTTHKSVPMLLSELVASDFGDSIYTVKGIPEAFNEAGFHTAFFSNQQRNHSFIDFFALQADETVFVKDSKPMAKDRDLLPLLKEFVSDTTANRLFAVLHTYGSHFNYRERYDSEFSRYKPDNASEANSENKQALINAYDNSIRYTDKFLDEVISVIDSLNVAAAVVYTSDHGEDIFDDERGRFLHASPTPTFTQIHVPFLIWTSETYNRHYPDKLNNARANAGQQVSSSRSAFNTILSLAGISSPKLDSNADLCSPAYAEPTRLYLNDYNQGVSLRDAGFRKQDFKRAEMENISTL